MSGVRVLVTRPQPGADRTAARLAGLGYEPALLPLTQTVALAQKLPMVEPDVVVATSPQAFHHLSDSARLALAGVPVMVTGEGTQAAARNAGLRHIDTGGGDVAGLIERLGGLLSPDSRILYLAGRIRRPDLELFIRAKTAKVELIEVYDTISVSYSTDKLREVTAGGPFSSVLLTSVETALAMAAISNHDFAHAIESSVFICLSRRIEAGVKDKFANPVAVAGAPTEEAMIACLQEAIPLAQANPPCPAPESG